MLNGELSLNLLSLPHDREFPDILLYTQIARLSYIGTLVLLMLTLGDFRMMIKAENPNKIANIVSSQIELIRELYAPILSSISDIESTGDNLIRIRVAGKEDEISSSLRDLPDTFQAGLGNLTR
jgi:hypothetical protein